MRLVRTKSRIPQKIFRSVSTVKAVTEIVDSHTKGDITLKILRAVREMSIEGIELCEAIIIAGYGASDFRIRRIQEEMRDERLRNTEKVRREKQYLRNYQKLVSKLKTQGLLKVEDREGRGFFSITAKGSSKLAGLESLCNTRLPGASYNLSPSERSVIVSFDIPEKQKSSRDWIREVLKRLGLKMVHKSVWIGKVKIPKQFLDDLAKRSLLRHIEIFAVEKAGTLRHIA